MVRKMLNYFQLLDRVFETSVLYIISGLDEGARERNFVPQGNFALYPSYHIPSKTEQSFMFKIMFHVSGRYPVIHYINLFLYIVEPREKEVCIEALKMYTLASVLAAITRQHPMEVVAAPHLHPDDFTHIMKETLQPFYNLLRERRGEWGEDLQKIPVICIGPQVCNYTPICRLCVILVTHPNLYDIMVNQHLALLLFTFSLTFFLTILESWTSLILSIIFIKQR